MNYIHHMNQFFKKIEQSDAVLPSHISLYLALFQCWNYNRFQNPIASSRTELMHVSKISSKTTFYKCIHDLSKWKWIEYSPSNSCYRGSLFRLHFFEESNQKQEPKNRTTSRTTDKTTERIPNEPVEVPLIQTTKTSKNNSNDIENEKNIKSIQPKNYNESF